MAGKEAREQLSQEEIAEIKKLLWRGGLTQKEIARNIASMFNKNIDQATVSRVKNGTLGRNVPWPDGFTGAFDKERTTLTWSSEAEEFSNWPDDIRQRMLWAVNEKRRAKGNEELPPIDSVYQQWISAGVLDPKEETELMILGREREDARRTTIQREFTAIMQEKIEEERAKAYNAILQEEHIPSDDSEIELPSMQEYACTIWENVVEDWFRVPAVKMALSENDPFLKEALCILKHAVPNISLEDKEYIAERVFSIRKRLIQTPDIHERIKKKHA